MPSYAYNSSNELTSSSAATYTYDNNGNTLTKALSSGTTQYGWDFENRLSSVALPGSGGTVNFKYDPFGRRIQKAFTQASATTTTNYVYNGADSVQEVDQNAILLARYTDGPDVDEPLAELRSGMSGYYEADGLGSVTSLGNGTGALTNSYVYDAFGNLTSSTGTVTNPYQYTARDFDPETGLRYYRARYYDPAVGRFLSEDPIGFLGSGDFYGYVDNGPVNSIDPAGLKMSPAECKRLRKQIFRMSYHLDDDIQRYDPILDGRGGPTWTRGGHYKEMGQYVVGIVNRITVYYKECTGKDNDPNDGNRPPFDFCWKKVKEFKRLPLPVIVIPITDTELQLQIESAQYMERFWEDILIGDYLLSILATAGGTGLLGGSGAVGARGLVPMVAH